MSPRPPLAAQSITTIRWRQALLVFAALVAALLLFIHVHPFWTLRSDLFQTRQVLAQGGGIEITSSSPILPNGISSAGLILTAHGRGRLTLTGRQVNVILLVNDRWWLNFPTQHRTLVGRDDLPAFDLGRTMADAPVIPLLPRLTLDPNSLFLVMWKLPDWGASASVAGGWKYASKDGNISLFGRHDSTGSLAFVEVRGPFPHDETLQLYTHFLSAGACNAALSTPVDFTAKGTNVEEVPTALLQKSIYGALQVVQKEISR